MYHYGLSFEAVYMSGVQCDKPGTNASRWERVWTIVEEPEDTRLSQVFDAARRLRASELEAARRRELADEDDEHCEESSVR